MTTRQGVVVSTCRRVDMLSCCRVVTMIHQPVLVPEVLQWLAVKPDGIYVDGTLGTGGHALALLESSPNIFLVGIDRDGEVLEVAKERLKNFGRQFHIHHANFSELGDVLKREKLQDVDGILLDLGLSSWQLEDPKRGFSFQKEGPIDMRMDTQKGETAFKKIKRSYEKELVQVLKEYGEERFAARIANGLLVKQRQGQLHSTRDIEEVAYLAYPAQHRHQRIHPATKTFQALRIWVNEELECLKDSLKLAPHFLKKDGRLCIISYHSLEDRLVKHAFRDLSRRDSTFKVLTKKPVRPSLEEIHGNARARSAKLRALARVA